MFFPLISQMALVVVLWPRVVEQGKVVKNYFEYFLHVWKYVAVQELFLYLKLYVIYYHCTPTGCDSHSNITHFISLFTELWTIVNA